MKWSIEDPKLITLSCDGCVFSPEDSREPLKEFWKRVAHEIAARYADAAFKVIFCELWPDSGRIVVYPSDRPPVKGKLVHERNERICLQVYFPWLESRFDALPDPDSQRGAFEGAFKALAKTVLLLLAEAVQGPEVAQELERLRAKSPFRICINDDENLYELRLAPRKPAVTKWKDVKNKEQSAEERAIEFFSGLSDRAVGIPVTIQRGTVYGIDLSGSNSVTDEDLAHLLVFPKLEKLELQNTSISDAGLQEIGKVLTLRRLDLSITRITDSGLRYLCNLNKLWKLSVWKTAVTPEGIDFLKAALPAVKVEV